MVGVSRLSKQGMSSGHGAPDSTELPAPLHGAERGQRRPGHHHPDMERARARRSVPPPSVFASEARAAPSCAFRSLALSPHSPGLVNQPFGAWSAGRGHQDSGPAASGAPGGPGSKAKDAQAAGRRSPVRSAPAAPVGGASQCLVHARTDSTCGGPFSAADGCSSAASVTGLAVP